MIVISLTSRIVLLSQFRLLRILISLVTAWFLRLNHLYSIVLILRSNHLSLGLPVLPVLLDLLARKVHKDRRDHRDHKDRRDRRDHRDHRVRKGRRAHKVPKVLLV